MALGFAETAKLAVDLSLKGNFNSAIATSQKSLKGLNNAITDTQGRAYKAGQQIGTGIRRGAIIAVTALTALTGLFLKMAKEGQAAANVETIFSKAVSNSTKVSGAQVAALRAQEAALLNLAGVDDELIKTEQTRLIQMGLTGAQVLKLTPAILDLSKATGKDLLTATLAAGKAAEGNATSLQRFGVFVDKAKFKTDPFVATLDALNKKFGGTTQALSGGLNVKLDVLREKLANLREDAGQKLLPVLTRIVDVVGQKLVPAFGEFIDAILPSVIGGFDKIATFLQNGGGTQLFTKFLNTAKAAAPLIQKSAEATFTIVKAAVDLFNQLPPGIQQLAVGAFAINKLTGGLVTNIGGALIDLIGKSRGGSPANPVFVSAVGGGLGGVPGTGGGSSPLTKGLSILAIAGSLAAVVETQQQIAKANGDIGQQVSDAIQKQISGGASLADLQKSLAATEEGINQLQSNPINVILAGSSIDALKQQSLALAAEIARRQNAPSGPVSSLLDRGGREAGRASGKQRDDRDAVIAIKQGFARTIEALKNNRGTEAIRLAVREALRRVTGGQGNADSTRGIAAGLRSALAHTHDPQLQREIRAALAKVQAKIPGREFAARQLAKADALIRDGKVTRSDLRTLQGIERSLRDRGLPKAAASINAKIEAAKAAQVKASRAAGQAAAAAIRDKDLSVTVNLPKPTVTIRQFASGVRIVTAYNGANASTKGGVSVIS